MTCNDCEYRNKTVCMIFDDIILSFADSCFMDTGNDSTISGIDNTEMVIDDDRE